jgi:release factor glutamine methyltransferase
LLLLYAARRSRSAFLAHSNDELDLAAATHLEVLLERRREGEPIQYITGDCEFYGLPFRVTPDVLIPRPETEHLVESILGLAPVFAEPRIVDVGTGSGVIAVALAHKLPGARIAAIDVSAAALDLARENGSRNGVAERIRFLQGDLLAPVAGETFDFVVSNPPYVPTSDRDSLSVEVREYEPGLALFAGEDGLEIYRRLIPDACGVLASGGFIVLEMGCGQADTIRSLLGSAGLQNVEFTPDLQKIPRVASARKP